MGLLTSLTNYINPKPSREINGVKVSAFSSGASGTRIYSGYLQEEYLTTLQGTKGADKYSQMRREDAIIVMILRAIKQPIRSAQWNVSIKKDVKEEQLVQAQKQQALFSHILFNDLGKDWTTFTGEALTFVDYGYSLFEKTFKPVINDEKFGTYVGVRSLGWRSQRTIERWIVDSNGYLICVEQLSDGDTGRYVKIETPYLMHFCPELEGDNFEGISFLRACYGPYFRKNLYLKLQAAGIEKYNIPTPVLTVPAGKEESPEFEVAKRVLKEYTSNQSNYITMPEGWTLDIKDIQLDPEKIRKTINEENQEMVNSVLAGFLLLGQTQTGSYALGSTLGDFFGSSVQFLGDHLCQVVNRSLLADLCKINFGKEELLVELKVEGIRESASVSFADLIQKLIQSGAINKDSELEKFVREKFKLPAAVEAEAQEDSNGEDGNEDDEEDPEPTPGKEPDKKEPEEEQEEEEEPEEDEKQLAESKRPNQAALIRNGSDLSRSIVESNLNFMSVNYVERMRKNYKKASTDSQKAKVPNDTELPSFSAYREMLTGITMLQAYQATAPIKASMKLATPTSEQIAKVESMLEELREATEAYEMNPTTEGALKIGYLQRSINARFSGIQKKLDLSSKNIAAIKSRVKTMVDTQMSDLKKKIDLQYQTSVGSTDSERTLFGDVEESRTVFMSSPVITTGPDILVSQTVNDSILKETEDDPSVESYTFVAVDDDATTDICKELNNRTFAKDDPDLFRNHPPLHHNCRSYLMVNLASFKGNPKITEEPLVLSKAAQGDITLSEESMEKLLGQKKRV